MKNLLGLILLALVSTSHAESVQLKFSSLDDTTYTKLKITGSPLSHQTLAYGSYNFREKIGSNPSTTFSGFCVDPFQYASSDYKTYQKNDLAITDFVNNGTIRLANARKLFDNAYDSLAGDDFKTAGFHIALWEIFHDDLSTSTGTIQALIGSGGTNTTVLGHANNFLAALNGWVIKNEYNITFYKNAYKQDYVSVQPVPVPAAAWLFGSALIGFVTISNRRRV